MKKLVMFILIFITINIKTVSAAQVDYIAGRDRYETATLIAKNMSYDKAILINATALVDGLSASGLSGALNAPILLTDAKSIPQVTLDALNGVKTIYLVGGEIVISKDVENKLKTMGFEVKRVSGTSRFDTSINVAKEIERLKGVDEIYYVNGLKGEADAMSIAPVAAKNGNPVVLTDGKDTEYKLNVKSYAIGGKIIMSESFENFSERISGGNRFLTNKAVIDKFFTEKEHVYISKADVLIDSLTSSVMKLPVVLAGKNSDKSVLAGAKTATVLGNIDKSIVSEVKSYLFKDTVVFYSQHQDDETLFASSAIVDAIASVGAENVYMVLVTDGMNTNVFNQDRYKGIDRETKKALRDNEFIAACDKLGIYKSNIIFLNEYDETCKFNNLANAVLEFERRFDGNITHIAHSYKYDGNSQHLQNGQIVYDLYREGEISDARFFANFNYGSKIPEEYLIMSISDNEGEKTKVINAIEEYRMDRKDMIREGIGFKSVGDLFEQLLSWDKLKSYLHEAGA